jgi:3D (Asp-Asp-Asp) domain-containing protein
VTAYGINLTAGQEMLEIAIDPSVLQPLAYYHVWPNPFSTRGAFLAGDTGGAIKGLHIDTYDWRGRTDQDAWGARYGVTVTKAANPGAARATGQVQAPASAPTAIEAGCAQLAALHLAPGTYANPFAASQSITRGRIDMGVDLTATGPIDALGTGTVAYSQAAGTGWGPFSCSGGHGGAVVYRLAAGPDRGRYVYVAEGIIPTIAAGQQVRAGQQIATFTGCIETGWASGAGDQPLAAALGQQCTTGDPAATRPPAART